MTRRSVTKGFTLIEVLIAVTIFALFSVMAYGGLMRALEVQERIEAERTFWQALTLVFVRLDDDLAHARPRRVRDVSGGLQLAALLGQPTDTRAVAEPTLEFTRGGVPVFGDAARSDLQRVAYRLRDRALQRETWGALDRSAVSQPLASTLLDDVEELSVRFYAPSGVWVDRWPTEAAVELPRAVEVTVVITGRGAFTRRFLVNG